MRKQKQVKVVKLCKSYSQTESNVKKLSDYLKKRKEQGTKFFRVNDNSNTP